MGYISAVALIAMYIVSANGIVIPIGCWIAAWIIAVIEVLGSIRVTINK